jgi:UDP-N-acetylglucosamine 1-carboxyvinyltransferase
LSTDKLWVEGGRPLRGKVRVGGAKNAALALIAASVMGRGTTILNNVPHIDDVDVMIHILNVMGIHAQWRDENCLAITCPAERVEVETPLELTKKVRASNLFLGAFLGRQDWAAVSMPGGCDIGPRPMDLHLKGIQALGASVEIERGCINARAEHKQAADIYLDFPSVGATENIMMMASTTPGVTTIENAAKEPEIVNLASFLNAMGAKVRGAGTDVIKISGVPASELKAVTCSIIPDRIEAGTYMMAAAVSGGEVIVENIIPTHLHPVIAKLRESGAEIEEVESGLLVRGGKTILPVDVKTLPYPGFPTDMQSQILALLTKARGTSIIVENVFENRFQVADEINRMAAKIKVEGHTAIVEGVPALYASTVQATDLRAGAALIIAALGAEGTSLIEHAEHIFRGYEQLEEKFAALGANVRSEKAPVLTVFRATDPWLRQA